MANCHRQGNCLGLVLREPQGPLISQQAQGTGSQLLRLPTLTYFTSDSPE